MAYLPNKKIWFLLVFILLIFAGWFYFSDYKNKQIQYIAEQEKSPLAVVLEQTSQLDADSDADGLKDWEELLWKTDPNKEDTDGDGINDNEEITLNRNPLKAGPNDKISEKEDLVAQEKAVSDSNQNTLTAAYARKFLTEYMALKQQKGELTEEDKQNLVDSFMDNLEPLTVADQYSATDIKTVADTNDSVKKYAEEMKKIFIDEKQGLVSEPEVFKALMENIQESKDFQKDIESLNYSIGKYEELIKKMMNMVIPKELSENHLEAINGFNNTKIAIKNMTFASSDPVKAVMGRKLYDIELKRAYDALISVQNVFSEYKIYVFNNL